MSVDAVRTELTPFLAEAADLAEDRIRPDSHLLEDLEMDSLSVLELTVFTEDTFGVSVEDEFKEAIGNPDLRKDMTVDWLARLIDERSNADAD
ncbi:acyl carrier protein [Arthrobacter sp. UM1]|uniref:acyl carrier protein n=1 Tax=Arthrobacter sp. UM1 TaxID=2766776 RepID=UPI001CF6C66C|nr:phosphopantetheine-binding protein [Arthrobacter sp. UM1]MCB4208870.1 hypothetical protein [Arthrobacter sp. UM1]